MGVIDKIHLDHAKPRAPVSHSGMLLRFEYNKVKNRIGLA